MNVTYPKELLYATREPDISLLRKSYLEAMQDMSVFRRHCQYAYDDRRNWWPGKSRDFRKHGANAHPWQGATDNEAHVIEERINRLTSLNVMAYFRGNIRAYPVETNDMMRASTVSSFLRYMMGSGMIPNIDREVEIASNHMLEKGVMVTHVGWERKDMRQTRTVRLDRIQEVAPEVADAIVAGDPSEELLMQFMSAFNGLTRARARKALEQLRKNGITEVSVVTRKINRPDVSSLNPEMDVIFPSYVRDPQEAPYCFYRTWMTPQQILGKVLTDEWDKDWAHRVISSQRGAKNLTLPRSDHAYNSDRFYDWHLQNDDLIEVVYAYQRLIHEDDGSEGIYLTIFCENVTTETQESRPYGLFELQNGEEHYPFVVTKLFDDTTTHYNTRSIAEQLRGVQWQIKTERDMRSDSNQIATLPPLLHPPSLRINEYGPGRKIQVPRPEDIQYGPRPPYNPGSVELERTMEEQGDRICGLDDDPVHSVPVRQFIVNKFLKHWQKVCRRMWKNYQRYGDDQTWFRVTGMPQSMLMQKGDPDEDFDIMINFDVLDTDPEYVQKKYAAIAQLFPLDTTNTMSVSRYIAQVAVGVDPSLADSILMSPQQGQDEIVVQVTDDLAKIAAGIEMPARPNGHQLALQIIDSYLQQPDVAQQYQSNEAFRERIDKYRSQYIFAMQQQQNAQIGRIGTQPTELAQMPTQDAITSARDGG